MPKVFTQPASTVAMTANGGYTPIPIDEKVQLDLGHQQHCEDDCVHEETHNHARCHNSRLRRVLFSAVAFLVSVIIMMSVFCVSHMGVHGDGMMKRDTTTGSSGSTFTDNKYYLIVIFVGLFVVILLGICLSAWCCRGSFENPLCCPCYLCACCGGLACLECIGCGLCAAGVEEGFQ